MYPCQNEWILFIEHIHHARGHPCVTNMSLDADVIHELKDQIRAHWTHPLLVEDLYYES